MYSTDLVDLRLESALLLLAPLFHGVQLLTQGLCLVHALLQFLTNLLCFDDLALDGLLEFAH